MRHVVDKAADARAVGLRGQEHVRSKYNPAAVTQAVLARLEQIEKKLVASGRVAAAAGGMPAEL